MHINIDTQTDDPVTMYRMGRWLVQTYETYAPGEPAREAHSEVLTVKVDASEIQSIIDGLGNQSIIDAEFVPPSPPAVPVSQEAEWGDAELNADTDDSGNVTGLTASVSLPPGVPPPPTTMPTADVPPPIPAAPGATAELDKRGILWDGRIHAANRARKLDGSWKNKRGVDATVIAQIEGTPVPAETSEARGAPLASAAAPPPPPVAPAAPLAPTAPPPPPSTAGAIASGAVVGFREVMAKVGKLNHEQVVALLLPFGLKPEDMLDLVGNHALIASVNAAVDKLAQ